jgi:hypothetical protein
MDYNQYDDEEFEEDLENDNNDQVHINVLVKLLQKYKKYENLTQEEILAMFDTIEDLEDEVNRLIDTQQEYKENVALYNKGMNAIEENLLSSTMFGNNSDITYYILLNTDIKTLNRYCQSNKSAHNICKDKSFWNTKIQQDILQDIKLKHIVGYRAYITKYPEVYNFYLTKRKLNGFEKYDYLSHAKKYTNYILTIYDIEYKSNNNQMIRIIGLPEFLLLSLPVAQKFFDKYYKAGMKNEIRIQYTNDKNFKLFIYNNGQPITVVFTKTIVKHFFIKLIYNKYLYDTHLEIIDNIDDTPYIVQQDDDIDNVSRRKGMFQILDNTN